MSTATQLTSSFVFLGSIQTNLSSLILITTSNLSNISTIDPSLLIMTRTQTLNALNKDPFSGFITLERSEIIAALSGID